MKMISFEEYDALKAYMEPKLFELWQHENEVRKEKGLEELNYFQIGFPITEVYHYYVEGDHNFYIVFNVSCHRLLQEGILEALETFPEKFGTGNAMDVVDALYEGSHFKSLGNKERYIQFLVDNVCCYIVYANRTEFGDILRLDTFRSVEAKRNSSNAYDFTGGLLHVLKHFSHEDRNLAVGKDVHDLFDLEHLVYLIAMAFRLKVGEGSTWEATQELKEGPMKAVFYKEEVTGFYFIKTYHRFKKSHNREH